MIVKDPVVENVAYAHPHVVSHETGIEVKVETKAEVKVHEAPIVETDIRYKKV